MNSSMAPVHWNLFHISHAALFPCLRFAVSPVAYRSSLLIDYWRIADSLWTCSGRRGAARTRLWGARAPRRAVSWPGRAAGARGCRGWLKERVISYRLIGIGVVGGRTCLFGRRHCGWWRWWVCILRPSIHDIYGGVHCRTWLAQIMEMGDQQSGRTWRNKYCKNG